MDRKLKTKWVRALRSGRYRQATGDLKSNMGSYCCLGVLCTIMGAKWERGLYGELNPEIDGNVVSSKVEQLLRPSFLRQIGLTKGQQKHLVRMNDGWPEGGVSRSRFKQIADYIEAKL